MIATRLLSSRKGMIGAGLALGVMTALLQLFGNPPNMGLCMVCFPRDMAGAIGLHRAEVVQYLRPEIMALVLGSFAAALAAKEWRPRGGSAPVVRFMLGIFAVIGALAFLGCPWRAVLRLAAGDWNSLVGIGGLVVGIGAGCVFLRLGYSLGRSRPMPRMAGWIFPALMVFFLGLLLLKTSFKEGHAIFFSQKGPGAMHAPVGLSIAFGLAIGFLAQRTRFCTMGSIRDALLIRDFHLASGVIGMLIGAFFVNLATGPLTPGWAEMPISHMNHAWNFLGMVLAGLAFALGGGCPGRQFFLAGEGDGDAAVFCFGMFGGAGIAHNWFLAGVPDKMVQEGLQIGGPGGYGKIAVVVGIVFCVILGLSARQQRA